MINGKLRAWACKHMHTSYCGLGGMPPATPARLSSARDPARLPGPAVSRSCAGLAWSPAQEHGVRRHDGPMPPSRTSPLVSPSARPASWDKKLSRSATARRDGRSPRAGASPGRTAIALRRPPSPRAVTLPRTPARARRRSRCSTPRLAEERLKDMARGRSSASHSLGAPVSEPAPSAYEWRRASMGSRVAASTADLSVGVAASRDASWRAARAAHPRRVRPDGAETGTRSTHDASRGRREVVAAPPIRRPAPRRMVNAGPP